MPTLVAVRKNPWLRAFYERLIANGELPKVALTAATRKLLAAVYSVAKNGKPRTRGFPQLNDRELIRLAQGDGISEQSGQRGRVRLFPPRTTRPRPTH